MDSRALSVTFGATSPGVGGLFQPSGRLFIIRSSETAGPYGLARGALRRPHHVQTIPPSPLVTPFSSADSVTSGSESPPDSHSIPSVSLRYPLHKGGFGRAIRESPLRICACRCRKRQEAAVFTDDPKVCYAACPPSPAAKKRRAICPPLFIFKILSILTFSP